MGNTEDLGDKTAADAKVKQALCGKFNDSGRAEGRGWRMEFLQKLARARADGLLRFEQIRPQLPPDLLLAVEALAEELRTGNHVMPLVVLGNDWDFSRAADSPAAEPVDAEPESYVWPLSAVLAVAAAGFILGFALRALAFH